MKIRRIHHRKPCKKLKIVKRDNKHLHAFILAKVIVEYSRMQFDLMEQRIQKKLLNQL